MFLLNILPNAELRVQRAVHAGRAGLGQVRVEDVRAAAHLLQDARQRRDQRAQHHPREQHPPDPGTDSTVKLIIFCLGLDFITHQIRL